MSTPLPPELWWEVLRWFDERQNWQWLIFIIVAGLRRVGLRLPKPLPLWTPKELLQEPRHHIFLVQRWGTHLYLTFTARLVKLAAQHGHLPTLKKHRILHPNVILDYAAEGGQLEALRWAKTQGADNIYGAFMTTVDAGSLEVLRQLWEWEEQNVLTCCDAAVHAAYKGYLAMLQQLQAWGATNYEEMFQSAAGSGQLEILRQAYIWGAADCDEATKHAAFWGHLDVLDQLLDWGGDGGEAFVHAVEGGRLAAVELLHTKCAPTQAQLDWAMPHAAREGHLEILIRLHTWGARNYAKALEWAEDWDQEEAAAQLQQWMGE